MQLKKGNYLVTFSSVISSYCGICMSFMRVGGLYSCLYSNGLSHDMTNFLSKQWAYFCTRRGFPCKRIFCIFILNTYGIQIIHISFFIKSWRIRLLYDVWIIIGRNPSRSLSLLQSKNHTIECSENVLFFVIWTLPKI